MIMQLAPSHVMQAGNKQAKDVLDKLKGFMWCDVMLRYD